MDGSIFLGPHGRKKDDHPGARTRVPTAGVVAAIVYIDLVGLAADEARKKFLAGIRGAVRGKRQRREASSEPVPPAERPEENAPQVSQRVEGVGNVVVGGNFVMYHQPPRQKIVKERRPGAISTAQEREITLWIEKLAEGTIGMSRKKAYAMWGARFKNRFDLEQREDLPEGSFLARPRRWPALRLGAHSASDWPASSDWPRISRKARFENTGSYS